MQVRVSANQRAYAPLKLEIYLDTIHDFSNFRNIIDEAIKIYNEGTGPSIMAHEIRNQLYKLYDPHK